MSLHVVEEGGSVPDAPLVVLVHGMFDSTFSFRGVMDRLPDLHVIAYDRRGWGESRAARPAESIDDHIKDLLSVGQGRRMTVVGHSYGGNIALFAAARHPDQVVSIGVFEPPVPWAPWWPDRETQRLQAERHRHQFRAGMDDLPRRSRAQKLSDDALMQVEVGWVRTATFDFDDVRVPAVVGYATATTEYHVESAARVAAALKTDLMTIEGAGHTAHRTHPDEFAHLVRRAVALASEVPTSEGPILEGSESRRRDG